MEIWEEDGVRTVHKPDIIRGSRCAGIMVTPTDVYNIYSTGGSLIEWGSDVEQKYRAEVEYN